MEYCIDELKRTFPRTGVAVGDKHPGGGHKSRLSIRMKVFLTLLRLRKGYTYYEMAALFGWSAQTIWEACRKGESALRRALADFYRWPSEEQQLIACEAFRQKLGFSLNPEDMPVTAFAAVDGTYYCIPKPQSDELEVVYYSGYKKYHALKFSVIVCILSGRILHVAISPGSSTDTATYQSLQEHMIAEGAMLFGDKAYEGISTVVSPIKDDVLDVLRLRVKAGCEGARVALARAEAFNANVGKYRIRVEQGIGELKQWAAARGVPRYRILFDVGQVNERAELVAMLVNFLQTSRGRSMPSDVGEVRGLRDDDWFLPVADFMNSECHRRVRPRTTLSLE